MPPLDVGAALVLHDSGGAAELEASTSSWCGQETAPSADRDDDDPYDDAPAESLRLRIGEDIDWSDVGVGAVTAVLERDGSTKGAAANPKSRRSAAARSSLSSSAPPAPSAALAAVLIGGLLANKAAREHGRRRSRSRCRLQLQLGDGARVFASGEGAGGHQQQAEPGSPKVSCLGAVGVRSQLPRTAAEGNGITRGGGGGGRRWWAWLVADVLFRCKWKGRRATRGEPSRVE